MKESIFKKIKNRVAYLFFCSKRAVHIFLEQIKYCALFIYKKLKLFEIPYFIKFISHRYSAHQFNAIHVKHNLLMLFRVKPYEGLGCNRHGKLTILKRNSEKQLFSLKNIVLFNALQKRVEMTVFYTLLTLSLELNNPFDRKILSQFLKKKISLLHRLLGYVKKINGRVWNQTAIKQHIVVFERNSLFQSEVIRRMHLAVKNQSAKSMLFEAEAGLKKGLYPVLVTRGVSGSYWIRGTQRQILGLFKPFDEEVHAPNNPTGPKYRGALGLRKTRRGCRVGESPHHEVAAYLVDEFLGFGIVPKTYYAKFTHHTFFLAREDRFSFKKVDKTKYGSFQEFVGGFVSLEHLNKEEISAIPLEEFQLLVVLDVILGNTDRNAGNILFGDEKIAAIDHGLCFPDRIDSFCYWYWEYFSQGERALYEPILHLLNHFPFEPLMHQLHKKCFISLEALQCLRERVVLFTEAANAGLVPSQLGDLFKPEYLQPLRHLTKTLQDTAITQIMYYKEKIS